MFLKKVKKGIKYSYPIRKQVLKLRKLDESCNKYSKMSASSEVKKLKEEIRKANIIHNASGEAYTDWMRKWKASTLVNHLNQTKLGEE